LGELVLTTDRLTLETFGAGDRDLIIELHSDPEVNRFIRHDPVAWTQEQAEAFLAGVIAGQQKHGFGKYKVTTHDGTFVGRAGFAPLEETSEIELGYSFKKSAWGQGYATEAARALLDWFFDRTYFSHAIGFARTDHAASRRVLQKAGMDYRETRRLKDMPCDVFQKFSPSMQSLVANG